MKALHESRNRGRNNFVAAAVAAAAAANSAAAAAVASDVEKDVGGKLVSFEINISFIKYIKR
jgi:acyl-coenzyme A thioesterase PaaI-like protein